MTKPSTPSAWGIHMAKFWLQAGQSLPVDVKLLAPEATRHGFDVPIGLIKEHEIEGIDGMLMKRKTKNDWCIAYNPTVASRGRINFTLGHELGHYLLHRGKQDIFRCGQGEMLDYDSVASKHLEAEANQFSSYLLMPIPDFKSQIAGHRVTLDLIGHCADRYDTSFTATALKWIEFAEEAAIVVVARDGFICWSYPTQSARRHRIYFSAGTEVPQESQERIATLIGASNYTTRVAPGVWHSSMEAEESAILSDQFDMTIFLIRFPGANLIEHEEEAEEDSFSVLSARAQGYNWHK